MRIKHTAWETQSLMQCCINFGWWQMVSRLTVVYMSMYTQVEYCMLNIYTSRKTWLKLKFLQFCCWTSLVNFAIQLLIFRLQTFCSVHAIISTSVVIFIIFSLSLWAHLRCALNYWSIIFDTCFLRDILWHFFSLNRSYFPLFMLCEFLLMLKTKAATSVSLKTGSLPGMNFTS